MLAPALHEMRESAQTFLVGRAPGIHYLSALTRRCLDFEAAGWHGLFTETPDIPPLPDADLAVAFLNDPDERVKKNLSALFPGTEVHLYQGLPPPDEETHVALYLARCLQRAGCPLDPERSLEEALSRPLLGRGALPGRKGMVVLHPGSGGRDKNHPPEFWVKVIASLANGCPFSGMEICVLLGPAEEGMRSLFQGILKGGKGQILFFPERAFLVTLLSQAGLYVGHDSGITHLAAMLGTPTLALFRTSSVTRWRPLGPRVKVIRNPGGDTTLVSDILQEAGSLLRTKNGAS